MVRKADIPQHVIDTAMRLAAERGWARLSYGEIAEAAGLPLSKLYPVYPTKAAILAGLMRAIDAAVLAEQDPDDEEGSARDRLFDVMMRRYDALRPYREAVGNILLDLGRDPLTAAGLLPGSGRSMALMLELAGLSSSGLMGIARIKGLAAIHLATLRVWLRDESVDLAKTMAAPGRSPAPGRGGLAPGAAPDAGTRRSRRLRLPPAAFRTAVPWPSCGLPAALHIAMQKPLDP